MSNLPFVYRVTNTTTGLYYIGSRYARGCHPSDLWTTYFTSSKRVHQMLEQYGMLDWTIEILETFATGADAGEYERMLLVEAKGDPMNINICRSVPRTDLEVNAKMGKVKGFLLKESGRGIFNKDHPEYRKWRSEAGRKSGLKQLALGKGIHSQSKEERLLLVKKAREIQNEQGKNAFVNATKEEQASRGRRGGAKNKGFVWYTDGVRDFKYTLKMQASLSFEDFINQNPQFSKGRCK